MDGMGEAGAAPPAAAPPGADRSAGSALTAFLEEQRKKEANIKALMAARGRGRKKPSGPARMPPGLARQLSDCRQRLTSKTPMALTDR